MQATKAGLVGTSFGLWLLDVRDKLNIARAAWFCPESVGTVANDQLAALLVVSICLPGRVFVDVGAHIGSIVAGVKRRSRPSRIVAIEAIPNGPPRCGGGFRRSKIAQCAAGERDGEEVAFFVNEARSGYSSLARREGLREISVPLRTLDVVLAGHARRRDQDRHRGGRARRAARRRRGLVGASAHDHVRERPGCGARLGYSTTALWQFLDEIGYVIVAPNRLAHDGDGMSLEAFNDGHLYPRRTTNYFAVPSERRGELRDRARVILGIQVRSRPRSRARDSALAPVSAFAPHDA